MLNNKKTFERTTLFPRHAGECRYPRLLPPKSAGPKRVRNPTNWKTTQSMPSSSAMDASPSHPEDLTTLYHRAFAEYGTVALWNLRPVQNPTPADALAITQALRTHGKMAGRRLAERIEILCRTDQHS